MQMHYMNSMVSCARSPCRIALRIKSVFTVCFSHANRSEVQERPVCWGRIIGPGCLHSEKVWTVRA